MMALKRAQINRNSQFGQDKPWNDFGSFEPVDETQFWDHRKMVRVMGHHGQVISEGDRTNQQIHQRQAHSRVQSFTTDLTENSRAGRIEVEQRDFVTHKRLDRGEHRAGVSEPPGSDVKFSEHNRWNVKLAGVLVKPMSQGGWTFEIGGDHIRIE